MKTIRWILVGLTSYCFIPLSAHAQKPQPGTTQPSGPAILKDIAAQYAAMEKSIEAQYAKLKQGVKKQKDAVEDAFKQQDQRIQELKDLSQKLSSGARKTARAGQDSNGPATEREIYDRMKAIDAEIEQRVRLRKTLKFDLGKLDAELFALEEQKQKAIAELRKEKEKALAEARKAAEEKNRRG